MLCCEPFYQLVLELLQTPEYHELNKHVLVLTNTFDSGELMYIDECHVSPNGNKIIAEKKFKSYTEINGTDLLYDCDSDPDSDFTGRPSTWRCFFVLDFIVLNFSRSKHGAERLPQNLCFPAP